jgi:hypothetical protein
MDGETTRCGRCGAQLSGGRFCTNCGAPIGWTPTTPGDPAYDEAPTNERLHAVPDEPPRTGISDPVPVEPVRAPPLFRDEVYSPPPPAAPVYAEPDYPEPAPPPRRTPGVGLWVGAAVGLVVVLVLGAFLLLSGGGDDSPSDASSPLIPEPHHSRSTPPSSSATSSSSASAPAPTPTGSPTDVAGLAAASAPAHAPAGVDFAGRTVTYVAPNMVDGIVETCWRTPGDATGMVLTFRLDQPTQITKVGLINGYAKTAVAGGRRYDWYRGDRRVLAVEWVFDDGSTVSQDFAQIPAIQTRSVPPVTTSTVQIRITSVSPPGRGPAARNDTAISEVSLVGRAS